MPELTLTCIISCPVPHTSTHTPSSSGCEGNCSHRVAGCVFVPPVSEGDHADLLFVLHVGSCDTDLSTFTSHHIRPERKRDAREFFSAGTGGERSPRALSSLMKCLLYRLLYIFFFLFTHGGCSNEAEPEIAVGLALQNYDIPCENLPKSQWLQPCVRFLYL